MSDITAVAKTPTGEAIAGDGRGNLTVLNGAEKPFWKFKSGGEISRIFVNGSQVVAASHDNFVYQLRMRNGDVEWKKRLGGRVQQMAILNGQYVLTASFDEKAAVLTDILTGKVVGQIPFSENETIAAPPSYSESAITILTDRAVHQYSLSGCPAKKESGPVSIPRTASPK
jgi:outer membrane protein assembly factor BamB